VTHLVWDWNGTLLDDFTLVLAATNTSVAALGGPTVTAVAHRRDFRRPIAEYYTHVLGRPLSDDEFVQLDRVFHEVYRQGLATCQLAPDAVTAMASWPGTQSLLSMFFHDELLVEVDRWGLAHRLIRVDGLRGSVGGDRKARYLMAHLEALGVNGSDCVLIGDSVDDGDAAVAAGAGCVLYAGGFTDADRLAATGLPVAHTLRAAVAMAATAAGAVTAAVGIAAEATADG
jgi:phosphoglycolate phosphatase-like HAD superfamily hydrolase